MSDDLQLGDITTVTGKRGHFVVFDLKVPSARGRADVRGVRDEGHSWTAHVNGRDAFTLLHRPVIEVGSVLTWIQRKVTVINESNGHSVRCWWTQTRKVDGGVTLGWDVESDLPLPALVLENLERFITE